ncbi:choline transporter-like protein 1 isoform X1 [Siniperca chuatsi]|uniref:choline transporter-like protein 1 isoform X1 n=1 Tax=Siniperca chuatsi TaxID=119488 RepID=UPI001CE039A3|nr:choline transporter-like protein 1 isoform X1 [Siniperca chuatsi]XP_044060446.1 choline transporter-like protein 1 isoform X1 [Siniperca chuatsi]
MDPKRLSSGSQQQVRLRKKRTKREWRPLEDRSCTDLPWFLLFTVFCVGMGSICGFTIVTGGAARLVFGYDSYGNTCGQRNEQIEGVRLSGLDHTDRKFVFFLDPCNIDIVQRKIKSMALCVSLCPTEELKTYQDLKRFAMLNGSELCSYELAGHKYPGLPERFSKCPKLPVPPSKPLPVFNRCTPLDVSCYAKFAEAVVTFVSDNSVLHRLIAGVAASKEIIIGLCVLALVLSMILMVIIRYISAVLVWILTSLVVLGSLAGTSVLWWLYIDHRLYGNDTTTKVMKEVKEEEKEEAEVSRDSGQALLVYAVAATVFTIILLLLMLFMRKRVALTIALFHVAGKVFIHLPLLTLQPFVTFLALLLFWIYWILVLLFLGTTGNPVQNEETGLTEFRLTGPLQYLTWYHAVGLVWITEFILACQQMTVAGAVVTYYFTRDKNRLPVTPILSSVLRLVRYHLGTVAKGSFIITLVKIPRLVLMYVHNQLKGKENACARCLLKTCICCLWCLEKCLNYLNQNAYAATAINSTSFCTSARDAFVILVENALRVATINAVGDFVLFLGKILIVTSTAFAGVVLLNYQRDYAEWLLPLIIVCLFSFLVAHCFLSIFEIVVDVLFLCFAIDTKYNDGTPGKEFFMDKALMEFVESSRRLERAVERGRSRVKEAVTEGAEMKPMVSDSSGGGAVARRKSSSEEVGPGLEGGGEWEELQEFQVYYLLVGVLVDWVLTEQSGLVLCLSEDVVLFLCVYLPTSTLFLFVSLLHTPSPAPSGTKSAAVTAAC